MSEDVSRDVLNAETIGQEAHDEFIQTRLQAGVDFFKPVKRLHLKTMSDMNRVAKKGNAVQTG